MKTQTALLAGIASLIALAVMTFNGPSVEARMAPAATPASPRYQITAYASGGGEKHTRGYYVIDTTTGDIWHSAAGGQPRLEGRVKATE